MLTYVIVIAAVVVVLFLSFRALGGGEPVAAEDYRSLLARLLGYAAGRADQLDAALSLPATPVVAENGRKPLDPLVEAATGARKALSGYQQQLARIETEAGGDEREALLGARSLLSAAIEDYGWACRMVEAGGYRDNSGVREAVDVLRSHARDCMAATEQLVGGEEST